MAIQPAPMPIPIFPPVLIPEDAVAAEGGAGLIIVCVATATLEVREALEEPVEVEADVELDFLLVAILADAAMVVIGIPADSKRNLPTPVLQQFLSVSQQ